MRQFYPLKWKLKQKKKAGVRGKGKDQDRAEEPFLSEPDLKLGNLKYVDLSFSHSEDFSG